LSGEKSWDWVAAALGRKVCPKDETEVSRGDSGVSSCNALRLKEGKKGGFRRECNLVPGEIVTGCCEQLLIRKKGSRASLAGNSPGKTQDDRHTKRIGERRRRQGSFNSRGDLPAEEREKKRRASLRKGKHTKRVAGGEKR